MFSTARATVVSTKQQTISVLFCGHRGVADKIAAIWALKKRIGPRHHYNVCGVEPRGCVPIGKLLRSRDRVFSPTCCVWPRPSLSSIDDRAISHSWAILRSARTSLMSRSSRCVMMPIVRRNARSLQERVSLSLFRR